jgi:hypothetical protein
VALRVLVGAHVSGSQSLEKQRKAPVGGVIRSQLVEQHFSWPVLRVAMDMLLDFSAQSRRLTAQQRASSHRHPDPQALQQLVEPAGITVQLFAD